MVYRVVQWTTGTIGAEAVRGITAHPELPGHAAVWLASDEAEWITGSEITADGGVRYNSSEF